MSDKDYRQQFYRYCGGLIAALILVYAAYFATVQQWLTGSGLAILLLTVASIQLFVQMVVFLHVYDEKKPRWTLVSIIYTIAMLLIVVVASLWIMANMNYNMHMTPEQMQDFMLEQNRKGF